MLLFLLITNQTSLKSQMVFYFVLYSFLCLIFNNGYGPSHCHVREWSFNQLFVIEITLNLQWASYFQAVYNFETFSVLSFSTKSGIMDSHDKLPYIDKLSDSNWPIWKLQMTAYLQVKELWDLVDGFDARPQNGAENEEALAGFIFFFIFFLSILIIIYKDNNKDDTTGSKLIVIFPVAITQRGASERYVPSQGWVREQGKGAKLGKTMIRENLRTLVQGEIVGKSKDTCTYCKSGLVKKW